MGGTSSGTLGAGGGLRDTTAAVQDYLKAIYKLQQRHRPVQTAQVAGQLGLSAAAVSKMLRHLSSLRLVEHHRYQGVTLTGPGEKIALEVIRHHRLLELYLVEALGLSWDRVDGEAEVLEHVLSEDVEDRIAALLGHPARDPHGDPIPTRDGAVVRDAWTMLAQVPVGGRARIMRVPDRDAAVLRYLDQIGLVPDADALVVRREPLDGPLHVEVVEGTPPRIIGREIAERIVVSS